MNFHLQRAEKKAKVWTNRSSRASNVFIDFPVKQNNSKKKKTTIEKKKKIHLEGKCDFCGSVWWTPRCCDWLRGWPADYTLTFLFFTQNSKVEQVELDSFYQTTNSPDLKWSSIFSLVFAASCYTFHGFVEVGKKQQRKNKVALKPDSRYGQ